ncbi:hypothetical protein LCGC14_2723060 [marine sediment metagenome]|uniref:Uncharacterized protein n=1 Tax=marine sediment metagenome TaxID=412755 RepID=A0A0F9C1A7_9ZZZZ
MGIFAKFFKKKSSAERARRKGERVVAYKGGYQLRKVKKKKNPQDDFSIY